MAQGAFQPLNHTQHYKYKSILQPKEQKGPWFGLYFSVGSFVRFFLLAFFVVVVVVFKNSSFLAEIPTSRKTELSRFNEAKSTVLQQISDCMSTYWEGIHECTVERIKSCFYAMVIYC